MRNQSYHHPKLRNPDSITLKSGRIQRYPLSPILGNIVLELLAEAIGKEQGVKDYYIVEDKVKLFLLADDMDYTLEILKHCSRKFM